MSVNCLMDENCLVTKSSDRVRISQPIGIQHLPVTLLISREVVKYDIIIIS